MRTRSVVGAAAVAISVLAAAGLAIAQQNRQGGPPPNMGEMLVKGLQSTPGCLGVDGGEMSSGKNVIIAWFENKAAAKRWYYSDTHQYVIKGLVKDDEMGKEKEPLAHVKDEQTPVMVIASITFSDRPHFDGLDLPISQIAIELYAPLPGGAFLGERLAPNTFKVEHMRDFTPPEMAEAETR